MRTANIIRNVRPPSKIIAVPARPATSKPLLPPPLSLEPAWLPVAVTVGLPRMAGSGVLAGAALVAALVALAPVSPVTTGTMAWVAAGVTTGTRACVGETWVRPGDGGAARVGEGGMIRVGEGTRPDGVRVGMAAKGVGVAGTTSGTG